MSTTMKRTTTGLLQGTQSGVNADDLQAMVDYISKNVENPETLRALRLDTAKSIVRSVNAAASGQARGQRILRTAR
ncbi:hypothetical protein KBW71_04725 [Hydrogenophaga aromaticivorans]|uniref:hypothetical protein n=1 Tax=Hydrogenophaga aromaticivorans TaxID=2610898 RepID=UPI001B391789|nr:hypothetical protein [Hydrogenophaga aromaticivorans]MBQ0917736.1 hypothetical protein [Hydrogenophaga aromaticivorans]